MQSARILTEDLIDYAGLFPPAALQMDDAVRNYADHISGSDASMLGRFVLPGSRLAEFAASAAGFLPRGAEPPPWTISVLLGDDFETEITAVLNFNCEHWAGSEQGHAVIDAAEIKVADVAHVKRLKAVLPAFYRGFLEISTGDPDENLLDAIRETGFSAKIRTGGIDAHWFPPASSVIRILSACKERGLAFKATAGLHHIICGAYPLTYEPNAATGEMFGFLNVFLAAAFLFNGASTGDAEEVLLERDGTAFEFADSGVRWRGKTLSVAQIRDARREFAVSFGSCSFTEPVDELKRLIGPNIQEST